MSQNVLHINGWRVLWLYKTSHLSLTKTANLWLEFKLYTKPLKQLHHLYWPVILTSYSTILSIQSCDPIHQKEHTSFTDTLPLSAVPVITVPWPLILKQWSTEKINGPWASLSGMYVLVFSVSISSVNPTLSVSAACHSLRITIIKVQFATR